ncbi:ATP-binding protein [Acidipropionibacterium acidipropionici]|uniref:ATP-binding protein n=1 Tax=Acidipropionibacterium acidipropionici TaxID=1748 RepID=A0A142KJV0_9ACTN|nr:ATP-binding protein [Acidipropionibacterium acidipropionici]AMS05921.1 ATP-binding protein [Acidipropionibacterium acidipropionici]AMS05926.1 ATP-binding protein [Acidipropionibacterium acidipropionici]AMS06175.1 ATP-binding protein [Acidipropionibacterium acidipropionici]AMS06388.1 ATP-binding protein [Acidipropionibacterium acidipropionici]AOZ47384.1 ATP-binding protein [Acidipropionibacterium acidipropionici]
MSIIDIETARKLREMGSTDLLGALEAQDEQLSVGLAFGERIRLAVDDAYTAFTDTKVTGLLRRAGLRYPAADLRSVDLVDQRGLDRSVLAELGACGFVTAHRNIVLQGFTGSGKSYLASAIVKAACTHRYRAHMVRMPDLAEAWQAAGDRPQGTSKFIKKYTAFTVLVLDEWLLDRPDESMRAMLLELMERRYDTGSTIFATQYAKKDWHSRLGGGVHADAIMDRIVHNAIWINTGEINMREHTAHSAQPLS